MSTHSNEQPSIQQQESVHNIPQTNQTSCTLTSDANITQTINNNNTLNIAPACYQPLSPNPPTPHTTHYPVTHTPPQVTEQLAVYSSAALDLLTLINPLDSSTPRAHQDADLDDELGHILSDPLSITDIKRDATATNSHIITHNKHWDPPAPSNSLPQTLKYIYKQVAQTNQSNMDSARVPVPSNLDINTWHKIKTGHDHDTFVLDGVTFGFPLEYLGRHLPTLHATQNHFSARQFPQAIEKYITKELQEEALAGPFSTSPFTPFHVSPLMTRPKSASDERRIIVDLSFPEGGVNQWVVKGLSRGELVSHNLPTIANAIEVITLQGIDNTWLSTIDISRAYRNFRTCPKDWPLLGIMYSNNYYLDTALPFGARMSSYYMQRVAEFISRALKAKGIKSLMYLDDLLIISTSLMQATHHHDEATRLITSLGLPVAPHKVTPPTKSLVWLGISFDMIERSISIPTSKLQEISKFLDEMSNQRTVTIKCAQRAVGLINHLAKCVAPARLFMSRILAELRASHKQPMFNISRQVAADLRWFNLYLSSYNGRSLIKSFHASNTIQADACGTGFGAYDTTKAYSFEISTKMTRFSSTQLECINCLLAIRTFVTRSDRGTTIMIMCDNMPSIFAYAHGRARDSILAACSRAAWHHAETCDVRLVYQHVPGVNMITADALSRAHIKPSFQKIANEAVEALNLKSIDPDLNDLNFAEYM